MGDPFWKIKGTVFNLFFFSFFISLDGILRRYRGSHIEELFSYDCLNEFKYHYCTFGNKIVDK